MSREAAVAVAKSADLQDLLDTLTTGAMATLDMVDMMTVDNGDGTASLVVASPEPVEQNPYDGTGAMVGWFVDDATADLIGIPGGADTESLHITLLHLGNAADLAPNQTRLITGVVAEVVARTMQMRGSVGGVGRFNAAEGAPEPFYANVMVPGLAALRADLIKALTDAGVALPPQHDPWIPHITLAWLPADAASPPLQLQQVPVWIDKISVAVAETRYVLHLQDKDGDWDSDGLYDNQVSYPTTTAWQPDLTVAKAAASEDRFTLAPWYIPDRLDAHGEWTDSRETQKALWGYVEHGDRDIRLQHNTDIVAGRWVEAVTWPVPVTLDMQKADGTVTKMAFPANTPFLGVIWEPWAFDLVKAGKIRGYSVGGKSDRLLVDLPEAA